MTGSSLLRVTGVLATAALLALTPTLAQSTEQPRPFYAGKQLTIVVGLPPGGGADAYARLVQLGRQGLAFATPLARYAVKQVCDGRRVGNVSGLHLDQLDRMIALGSTR